MTDEVDAELLDPWRYVVLEDGNGERVVAPMPVEGRAWRIRVDGHGWEHVDTDRDGRWIYRRA
jgi:hypothetical protein